MSAALDGTEVSTLDSAATGGRPTASLYQLRAIHTRVRASFVVMSAVGLYALLPGHAVVNTLHYLLVVGAGALVPVTMAVLPWRRLVPRGRHRWILYLWSALDVAVVSALVAITGAQSSDMYVLYAPIVVIAAASYSVGGQALVTTLCVLAYASVLQLGPPPAVAPLFMKAMATGALLFVASFIATELAEQRLMHDWAREDAQRRAKLLELIAASARELRSRSAEQVLDAVTEEVIALGFDAAGIALADDGAATYRLARARGPWPAGASQWPTIGGENVTVWSDTGGEAELAQRFAMPIRAHIRRRAVLLVGGHQPAGLDEVSRELLELLTARAGRALESAEYAESIAESERRFRSLVQNSSDLITVIDADRMVRYQSESSQLLLGRAPESMIGRSLDPVLHPDDVVVLRRAIRTLQPGTGPQVIELRVETADGRWRRIDTIVTDLRHDRAVGGILINGRDVTERQQLLDELAHRALHDELTGLPNRALIRDRLSAAVRAAAVDGRATAVLFIDLDDFKAFNDLFGHPSGDALLRDIGARLREHLGAAHLVGRFGGDEFVVVMEEVEADGDPVALATQILEALERPLDAGEASVRIRATIGVAHSRAGEHDADELLRRADLAMYAAKDQGKGRYAIFDTAMESALLAQHALDRDLRRALVEDQFEVHFQPIVSLIGGGIVSVEALVRWRHPERGLVSPDAFIPFAEETALIVPLGRLVLSAAVRQLAEWRERHPRLESLTVAVNVSPLQLLDVAFADLVAATLAQHGVPASALVLEITEGTLAERTDDIIASLRQLRALGARVAIDDFGTGYSSLAYVGTFPVDALKIDRSFIQRLGTSEDATTLVAAVIQLASRLGLSVIAEGVERPEHASLLRELGCTDAQGFLFSRPLPPAGTEALLIAGMSGERAA